MNLTMKPTILIVDDLPANLKVLRDALEADGYNLRVATSGQMALKIVEYDTPILILLDIVMPNMDGLTFVKQFREKGSKAPIIMVTTEAETSRVVEAIKAGVNNYVVKPFTPDGLGERIKETLDRVSAA